MNVIVIPSWYKTKEIPTNGIFFRDHAQALQNGCHVIMVVINHFTFRNFWKFKKNNRNSLKLRDENGLSHIYINSWSFLPGLKFVLKITDKIMFNKLIKYLNKIDWRPDIIHAHSVYQAGFHAQKISKLLNIPYVITEHRSNLTNLLKDIKLNKKILNCYENAAEVMAVSEFLKNELKLNGIKKSIKVITNIVNTDYFIPLNKITGNFVYNILFVGTLLPVKNIDILLRALEIIIYLFKITDIKLKIGGYGPELNELVKLTNNLNIDKYCTFLGYMDRPKVKQEMQKCDLFILPSKKETFGIVLLESMACGNPVIATACGGPEDIVKKENGKLIKTDSVNELAEGIVYMKNNVSKFNSFSIRNYVINKYSSKVIGEIVVKLLVENIKKYA